MSERPVTQAERLARIETLLDDKVVPALEKLIKTVEADVADLARMKNRGVGLLVGVGLVFTAFGALLHRQLDFLLALLK